MRETKAKFAIVDESAPLSYLKNPSTSVFLTLPTCVMKLYTAVFERLKVNFGLTTKCLHPGQFVTQEQFADLVGSVQWRLSGCAKDYILRITHTSSNAQKVSVGELLKVSMGVNAHSQLHILPMMVKGRFTLLLLIFSPVIVQAHKKFVFLALIIPLFCCHRLSCLVCLTTSGYSRLKFDGRKRVVQNFPPMIDNPDVSKLVLYWEWEFHVLLTDFGSARNVQGIKLVPNFDSQLHRAVMTAYQAPYMPLWMALLRWKYKFYSTDFRSADTVNWAISFLRGIQKTPWWIQKTPCRLNVIQVLYVWIWVAYLRWKFRLLTTRLWNEGSVKGVLMRSTSVLCLRSHWNSRINFPADDTRIHAPTHVTATSLLMLIILHSSLRTRMFFRGRQCCIPVYERGCPYHVTVSL